MLDFSSRKLLSETQLTAAVDTPLIAHVIPNESGSGFFNAATAMLALAIEEHKNPASRDGEVAARLAKQLAHLVLPGNEPFIGLGPIWAYAPMALAVGVAKQTPSAWNLLDEKTKANLDLLMRAVAAMFNFGTNAENYYTSDPSFAGNFNKDWNPNYRLACIVPMFGALAFFGSRTAVDAVLAGFDYDSYLAEFKAAGFTNLYARWSAGDREIMNRGGELVSPDGKNFGHGAGAKIPYAYRSPERKEVYTLDEPEKILDAIVERTFAGGVVVADSSKVERGVYEDGTPKAYTMKDGNENPVLGKLGMMTEFNGGDGGGYRSSLAYCHHDFVVTTAAMAALMELGMWSPEDFPERFERATVGQTDLIYKCEKGYRSFSLGKGYDSGEESFGGYFILRSMWYNFILGIPTED